MTTFFIIAGVTVTILGILAIAVILGVLFYVRVLGYPLSLRYEKTPKNDQQTDKRNH